jgi:hypothetical protein
MGMPDNTLKSHSKILMQPTQQAYIILSADLYIHKITGASLKTYITNAMHPLTKSSMLEFKLGQYVATKYKI